MNIDKIAILLVAVFLLHGCGNNSDTTTILDFTSNINNKPTNVENIVKEIKTEYYTLSDSVIIVSPRIVDITDKYVILKDFKTGIIMIFDKATKNLVNYFAKKSKDPQEYLMPLSIKYDKKKDIIVICEKVLAFDIDGNFVYEKTSDLIKNIADFDISQSGDNYIATTTPTQEKQYEITIFDSNWEIIKNLLPLNAPLEKHKGLIISDVLKNYNGYPVYRGTEKDTLFLVDNSFNTVPLLVFKQGEIKMPAEQMSAVEVDKSEYINNEYGYLSGDYYFSSYQYDDQTYCDIWNVKSGKLLCRNNIGRNASISDKGVMLGGSFFWPKYVADGHLYSIKWDSDNQMSFILTDVTLN